MSSGNSLDDDARTVTRSAVRERLDRVHDPELDRSIVELQYVEDITIEPGRITVQFVLPTAWCSPAFAWMMATGIRDELRLVPGVDDVRVALRDHMHETQINRGVNEGLAFQDVFGDAKDGVEAVRQTLDRKARMARQYTAMEALLEAGLDPRQIVRVTAADLEHLGERIALYLRGESVGVTVPADPVTSHLEKALEVGTVTADDEPIFAKADGSPIDPSEFDAVRRRSRLAHSNLSGQAGICAQLHEARNDVEPKDV